MTREEAFPKPILVINHADGSKYPFELADDFIYNWEHKGLLKGYSGPIYQIKVPKGYRTDFASIPRIFQGLFNAVNDIAPASIAHDWCYSIELFERSICDQVLYDAMRVNSIGFLRAKTVWSAVRAGGWTAWPHDPAERYADRELYRARFG
jgi:hypothetical protein